MVRVAGVPGRRIWGGPGSLSSSTSLTVPRRTDDDEFRLRSTSCRAGASGQTSHENVAGEPSEGIGEPDAHASSTILGRLSPAPVSTIATPRAVGSPPVTVML